MRKKVQNLDSTTMDSNDILKDILIETDILPQGPQVSIEIEEQPTPKIRKFRYLTELVDRKDLKKPLQSKLALIRHKLDGTIYGEKNPEAKKCMKIKINSHGYTGPAQINVFCVEKNDEEAVHPHVVTGKNNVANGPIYVKDIRDGIVKDDQIEELKLAVMSTVRGAQAETLRLIKKANQDSGIYGFDYDKCSVAGSSKSKKDNYEYDVNAIKLCFLLKYGENLEKMTEPIISHSVENWMLQVDKCSDNWAPINGGKTIMLLCQKFNRDEVIPEFSYTCPKDGQEKVLEIPESNINYHFGVAMYFTSPDFSNMLTDSVQASLYIRLKKLKNGVKVMSNSFDFIFYNENGEGLPTEDDKKIANADEPMSSLPVLSGNLSFALDSRQKFGNRNGLPAGIDKQTSDANDESNRRKGKRAYENSNPIVSDRTIQFPPMRQKCEDNPASVESETSEPSFMDQIPDLLPELKNLAFSTQPTSSIKNDIGTADKPSVSHLDTSLFASSNSIPVILNDVNMGAGPSAENSLSNIKDAIVVQAIDSFGELTVKDEDKD